MLVGIIANPASGKDIRRLVAHGSVFDNQEKVRIVRRVLLGLEALGVDQVCYMPDAFGIVERALHRIRINTSVYPVELCMQNNHEDSTQAARIMEAKGAGCIVTVGGDGTNRAVAKGNASIPMLPISTGTNNVFPFMVEGTIAGLAAGLVASGRVPLDECGFVSTKLEVVMDGTAVDLALVDAVVYDDVFAGSRAMWEMGKVRQIFLNRASPDRTGMSSIGGQISLIRPEDPEGLYLELGEGGMPITAPVGPGMIETVFVSELHVMKVMEEKEIRVVPSILALDGEREMPILGGQQTVIRLVINGPTVIDVSQTMATAVRRGILTS